MLQVSVPREKTESSQLARVEKKAIHKYLDLCCLKICREGEIGAHSVIAEHQNIVKCSFCTYFLSSNLFKYVLLKKDEQPPSFPSNAVYHPRILILTFALQIFPEEPNISIKRKRFYKSPSSRIHVSIKSIF